MKAILLSGGMDSTALSFIEKPDISINVNYGQLPASSERRASEAISKIIGMEQHNIDIDCSSIGSGDLAGKSSLNEAPESEWWPYRNQLLITLAATKALNLGCSELIIGTVLSDHFHKDGTPKFIDLMNKLTMYQEGGLKISAPAIEIDPVELIRQAGLGMEVLALTHSCHKSNLPCFECRGCYKQQNTLEDLGMI